MASTEADDHNNKHHKIVVDLLGPLLAKINLDPDDLDGASLSELAEQVSKGIIGTTIAAVCEAHTVLVPRHCRSSARSARISRLQSHPCCGGHSATRRRACNN